jgi:voltage-gated potassium channel
VFRSWIKGFIIRSLLWNGLFPYFFCGIFFENCRSEKQTELYFQFFRDYRFSCIDSVLSELYFSGYQIFPDFQNAENVRVFRVFNLLDFMNDGSVIVRALKNSSRKIYIFLLFLIIFSVIVGSLMFMVEGGRQGLKPFRRQFTGRLLP